MTRAKAILILAASIAFALSPLTTTGFNGFTPEQFPVPQIDPPIQPAGWAFSIWGVIYLWLIASAGYGLLRRDADAGWDAPRWPLLISLAIGATWVPVANASPIWATVLIWLMWGSAVLALLRTPDVDTWWLRAPIGIYAGWLTAASCVGTAVLATGYGATPVLTVHAGFLLLALALASLVLRRMTTPAYAIAVVWALLGIVMANADPMRPLMFALALIGIVLLIIPAVKRARAAP